MKKIITFSAFAAALFLTQGTWADGATIYEDTCSGCHGEDGKGAEGMTGVPDFTTTPAIWAKSDETLVKSVIVGIEKPGAEVTMPPRAGEDELTDTQIKDAIIFIRKSFGQSR